MPTVARTTFTTPQEYLTLEVRAEFKSEYFDGQIYAMAGTSYRQDVLASNLHGELFSQLRGQPCRPTMSDLRLKTRASDAYMYPDIMVICGPPQLAPNEFDTVLNPTVIIEVLSPSTESWDRGGKFARYRRIESLTDYVLVSQDEVLVEHYARQGEQWLLTASSRPDDSLVIGSIACTIPLADIYARVTFDPDQTSET